MNYVSTGTFEYATSLIPQSTCFGLYRPQEGGRLLWPIEFPLYSKSQMVMTSIILTWKIFQYITGYCDIHILELTHSKYQYL